MDQKCRKTYDIKVYDRTKYETVLHMIHTYGVQ